MLSSFIPSMNLCTLHFFCTNDELNPLQKYLYKTLLFYCQCCENEVCKRILKMGLKIIHVVDYLFGIVSLFKICVWSFLKSGSGTVSYLEIKVKFHWSCFLCIEPFRQLSGMYASNHCNDVLELTIM